MKKLYVEAEDTISLPQKVFKVVLLGMFLVVYYEVEEITIFIVLWEMWVDYVVFLVYWVNKRNL